MPGNQDWMSKGNASYTIYYTKTDISSVDEYMALIDSGLRNIHQFFNDSMHNVFSVYVHPGRQMLDEEWKSIWHDTAFKSECWMVASGSSSRLDILSPLAWEKEACEHHYTDKKSTLRLFTHELVHVYHEQIIRNNNFNDTRRIDWFVEGLATYVAGQCDEERVAAVKKAISAREAPYKFDDMWKGNNRYGYSGSMVMYLDTRYGRQKLLHLMQQTTLDQITTILEATESELIEEWMHYMGKI
jgi:hypothetical protein